MVIIPDWINAPWYLLWNQLLVRSTVLTGPMYLWTEQSRFSSPSAHLSRSLQPRYHRTTVETIESFDNRSYNSFDPYPPQHFRSPSHSTCPTPYQLYQPGIFGTRRNFFFNLIVRHVDITLNVDAYVNTVFNTTSSSFKSQLLLSFSLS